MIVRDDHADDSDDEWGDDHDYDADEDEDETTEPCPGCRRPVYDDAERCPHCGLYLSREDVRPRKPWWVVAGVATCLAMVTWWILHP